MNEKVVGLIKAQSDEGLSYLKQHYSGLMHYIVRNILENPDDIDECISDIIVKVWKSIESYSPKKGRFTTWLTVISRNTALNYLKGNDKSNDELKDEHIDSCTPEDIVLQKERADIIKKAISMLTNQEQHIFYRKYYYLQKTAQIAAELGMTERSVEGKLYRMRKKLQNQLGGDFK